jgi:hypothetical protein
LGELRQTGDLAQILVLPGDSCHVAASHAARCTDATLAFIERHGSG